MSETIERQLIKWGMPALISVLLASLLAMCSFLLTRAVENGKGIAVLTSVVQEGKVLREKAFDINTQEHKQIFASLNQLVSKNEMEIRIAEVKAQIALVEASIKNLEAKVAAVQVQVSSLEIQVKLLEKK